MLKDEPGFALILNEYLLRDMRSAWGKTTCHTGLKNMRAPRSVPASHLSYVEPVIHWMLCLSSHQDTPFYNKSIKIDEQRQDDVARPSGVMSLHRLTGILMGQVVTKLVPACLVL